MVFRKHTLIALLGCTAFLFAVGGYFFGVAQHEKVVRDYFEQYDVITKRNPLYFFTSSSVGSESPQATSIGMYREAYEKLKRIIDSHRKDASLSDVSLYYRDLKGSTWFGYNEDEAFIPASLLKLIYALSAYKQDEENPGFLEKRLQFTKEIYDIAVQRGVVQTSLEVGKWYTVRELIEDMMITSDNSARDLLSTVVYERYIDELYYLIGIRTPELRKEYKISAKEYSLFLRILYNSKFIDEKHSDELLGIMAQSTFTQGLVRGVDSKTPVSHKFGVYTFSDSASPNQIGQQIHDCGIIYYPDEPYLLCIMTKGSDQEVLASIIAELSKSVYESHKSEDL